MITALQRILSRHRRALFITLLAIVVIPFVFTIGAAPGIGLGKRFRNRPFFGINLNSRKAMEDLQRATALSLYLERADGVPLDQAMMTRAAWRWMVDRLQVPDPTEEQMAVFVRSRPAFQGESGEFLPERYRNFLDVARAREGLGEDFASRVLADDWRINLVAGALAAVDLSHPLEARIRMRQMKTRWTVENATFRFADFQPSIIVPDEDLVAYYLSNGARYRTPERVRVDCVFFPAEVTSTAKPTEEQLEDFFRLHRSDFGPEADGDEFQAKNRGRIAQAYATAEAHRRSVERADEFLCRVYECPVAGREEKIAAIAAEFGRPIRHLEPYAATELVTDLPAELLLGAFALNGEHSFTDPCPGDGGTHVLLLRERVEPRDLPLEEVRDDVERRCHRQRRVELFAQRARDIQRKIRGQMAQGESFPVAAKAFGLSVGNCHTFSLEMPPDSIDSGELAAILNLKAGEVSEFVLIKPDLRLWHVVALEVPEMDGEDEIATAIAVENVDPGGLALLRQLLEERILAELEGSQR